MICQNVENERYPFQPTISPLSKQIGDNSLRVDKNDGLGSIHDVLYLNAQYWKKEHDLLVNEFENQQSQNSCTFKPALVSKQSQNPWSLDDIINSKRQYEENMTEYKRALEA